MNEELKKLPNEEVRRVLQLPNSYYEKGKKEGKKEGIEKVIYNMLRKGLPEDLIADVSNVSLEEIYQMKKKFNL